MSPSWQLGDSKYTVTYVLHAEAVGKLYGGLVLNLSPVGQISLVAHLQMVQSVIFYINILATLGDFWDLIFLPESW